MSDGLPRINGGVGFAVEEPSIELRFESGHRFSIASEAQVVSGDLTERLTIVAEEWFRRRGLPARGRVTIMRLLPEHCGFGVTTAAVIGTLEGLAALAGEEMSAEDLVAASRRGGASGIGINTYFSGGL